MSNYNLKTEEERTKYLIDERRKNIKEFEEILSGKNPNYRYKLDSVFMNNVRKRLELEQNLLNDLLKNK